MVYEGVAADTAPMVVAAVASPGMKIAAPTAVPRNAPTNKMESNVKDLLLDLIFVIRNNLP